MNLRDFNNLPEFLYHAGPQCAEDAILAEGLKSNWGEIYLTTDPQHCCRFMGSRLLAHLHGMKEVMHQGQSLTFPNVVQHEYIPVFEVKRNDLDHRLMELSTDHDPKFYGEDVVSLVYNSDHIPASAITGAKHFA